MNENIKKIIAEDPSNWLEEAGKKLENQGARKNARKVALRVLQILREKNISQTELAERMGVSRQQVGKIVKGQENFTFETIDKLERALGIILMTIGAATEEMPKSALRIYGVKMVYSNYVTQTYPVQANTPWRIFNPNEMDISLTMAADANTDTPLVRAENFRKGLKYCFEHYLRSNPSPSWESGNVSLPGITNDFSEEYRISDQERLKYSMS